MLPCLCRVAEPKLANLQAKERPRRPLGDKKNNIEDRFLHPRQFLLVRWIPRNLQTAIASTDTPVSQTQLESNRIQHGGKRRTIRIQQRFVQKYRRVQLRQQRTNKQYQRNPATNDYRGTRDHARMPGSSGTGWSHCHGLDGLKRNKSWTSHG